MSGVNIVLQVIIPVKNRPEIVDCVRSLLAVGYPVTKIIICDGGTAESKCLMALQPTFRTPNWHYRRIEGVKVNYLRASVSKIPKISMQLRIIQLGIPKN